MNRTIISFHALYWWVMLEYSSFFKIMQVLVNFSTINIYIIQWECLALTYFRKELNPWKLVVIMYLQSKINTYASVWSRVILGFDPNFCKRKKHCHMCHKRKGDNFASLGVCVLGISPSLVSRWREGYSFWSSWGP